MRSQRRGDQATSVVESFLEVKIGIILNTFESDVVGSHSGGTRHMFEVARRWDDTVKVFAPEAARALVSRELPLAEFEILPECPSLPRQLRFLSRSIFAIRKRNALRACDVLLANSHFFPDVFPIVIAGRGRRAAVTIWHLLRQPSERIAEPVLGRWISFLFQSASLQIVRLFFRGLIVGSRTVLATIPGGDSGKEIAVTTNGIEKPNLLTPSTERRGAVFVGRIVPSKGLEGLIAAWAIVADKCDEQLTILGNGEDHYVQQLVDQINSASLQERVRIIQNSSDREKWDVLQSSRIFVFPSQEEGWGIALAEAMAAGLPCVTYDLPVFEEVFPVGRIAVPLNDFRALSAAVLSVVNDEDLWLECSTAASDYALSFSWQNAANIELGILQRLAKR